MKTKKLVCWPIFSVSIVEFLILSGGIWTIFGLNGLAASATSFAISFTANYIRAFIRAYLAVKAETLL